MPSAERTGCGIVVCALLVSLLIIMGGLSLAIGECKDIPYRLQLFLCLFCAPDIIGRRPYPADLFRERSHDPVDALAVDCRSVDTCAGGLRDVAATERSEREYTGVDRFDRRGGEYQHDRGGCAGNLSRAEMGQPEPALIGGKRACLLK